MKSLKKKIPLENQDAVALANQYFSSKGIDLTDAERRALSIRLFKIAGEPADRDSRSCFGVYYYDSEMKADVASLAVRLRGDSYNGGWFHGMPCKRDKSFDEKNKDGVNLYAVTVA